MKIGLNLRFLCLGVVSAFSLLVSTPLSHSVPATQKHELGQPNVRKILSDLPVQDVADLHAFFHRLFASGDFAYTLFGDKPMALVDYMPSLQLQFHATQNSLRSLSVVYRGSKVWDKHKHLFPTNKFCFVVYEDTDGKVLGFVLFDTEKVHKLFQQYPDLLKSVFVSEEEVATYLQTPSWVVRETCKNWPAYHTAVGVLLGYGLENSLAYGEKVALTDRFNKAPLRLQDLKAKDTSSGPLMQLETVARNGTSSPLDLSGVALRLSLKQLNYFRLEHRFCTASQRETALSPIPIPGFGAFPNNDETRQIQQAFDKVRERLVEIYYSEDFLETVLTRLTS